MEKAAVIGHPVSHSLSPVLFAHLAKHLGRELEYTAIEIAPKDLAMRLKELQKTHVGLNVTIPHKEAVALLSDEKTIEVTRVGAANVLSFSKSKIRASNTDVHGLKAAWAENNINLMDCEILVLGSGGAARAVVTAAVEGGASGIDIVSRNEARTAQLVTELAAHFPHSKITKTRHWQDSTPSDKSYKMIVNATPLGMIGFDDGAANFENLFKGLAQKPEFAFDLIYNPELTSFLLASKNNGVKIVNGLDMFIHQALATWTTWFGKMTFSADFKKSIKDELQRVINA